MPRCTMPIASEAGSYPGTATLAGSDEIDASLSSSGMRIRPPPADARSASSHRIAKRSIYASASEVDSHRSHPHFAGPLLPSSRPHTTYQLRRIDESQRNQEPNQRDDHVDHRHR